MLEDICTSFILFFTFLYMTYFSIDHFFYSLDKYLFPRL